MKVKKVGEVIPPENKEEIHVNETGNNTGKNKSLIYFFAAAIVILVFVLLYIFVIKKDSGVTDNDIKKKELELKEKELELKEQESGKQKTTETEKSVFQPLMPLNKKFKGAYFEISYPSNFNVNPSLGHPGGGYSSTYFSSPDGYVEFYIFSTWHVSENNEINLKPDKEFIEQNEIQNPNEFKEIKYYTYMAKDSSYKRSYMDVTDNDERTIYGFKYKNIEAYNYYKDSYLQFKKSLKQFGD